MITDAMKYDRLDQAPDLMRVAGTDLQRFGRGLRDVRVELDGERALDQRHAYTNTMLAELRELRRERERILVDGYRSDLIARSVPPSAVGWHS